MIYIQIYIGVLIASIIAINSCDHGLKNSEDRGLAFVIVLLWPASFFIIAFGIVCAGFCMFNERYGKSIENSITSCTSGFLYTIFPEDSEETQ